MFFQIPNTIKHHIDSIWEKYILTNVRETFFGEFWMSLPGSKLFFEQLKYFFKLEQFEFIKPWIPAFNPKKSNVSWIPINKSIQGAEEIALPEAILDKFIEKASHRVIVNFCGCRIAMGCKNYPHHIGCLMMGDSALLIPEKSRREVSIDEAKAHVREAIEAGLIPVTGKARIDNDIFMIPDKGKLLTVCFCCECCCVTRFTRYLSPQLMNDIHHPIEGLTIKINPELCIGCGLCVSKCYLNAIEIINKCAVIGDLCRVCGRCALYCPQKAIQLKLDNNNAIEDVVQRIESHVNFQA